MVLKSLSDSNSEQNKSDQMKWKIYFSWNALFYLGSEIPKGDIFIKVMMISTEQLSGLRSSKVNIRGKHNSSLGERDGAVGAEGTNLNFNNTKDHKTTTCQQRPLFFGVKGGRCTQV